MRNSKDNEFQVFLSSWGMESEEIYGAKPHVVTIILIAQRWGDIIQMIEDKL